jgi:hypothetical protein
MAVKSTGKSAKMRTVSTSEARKNFASALKTVHKDKVIIGFDRYTMSVAALAPVEAVLMLAGRGGDVEPSVRDKIEKAAKSFLQSHAAAPAPIKARAPAKAPAKKKGKGVKKRGKTRR